MLTICALIQIAINVALILCLWRLLRERQNSLRLAREREDRLEALAAELCVVGREMARQEIPSAATPSAASDVPPAPQPAPQPERSAQTPHGELTDIGVADRVRGAAVLLERGNSVEHVAAQTALLPGEVQVLKNLRRPSRRGNGASPGAASKTIRRATSRRTGAAQT